MIFMGITVTLGSVKRERFRTLLHNKLIVYFKLYVKLKQKYRKLHSLRYLICVTSQGEISNFILKDMELSLHILTIN